MQDNLVAVRSVKHIVAMKNRGVDMAAGFKCSFIASTRGLHVVVLVSARAG